MDNKEEKEIFSSNVVGGTKKDNLWIAIGAAAAIAIGGALFIRLVLGITGGLVTAIPVIIAFLVFKSMRNEK